MKCLQVPTVMSGPLLVDRFPTGQKEQDGRTVMTIRQTVIGSSGGPAAADGTMGIVWVSTEYVTHNMFTGCAVPCQ